MNEAALQDLTRGVGTAQDELRKQNQGMALRIGAALGCRVLPAMAFALALGFFATTYVLGNAPFSPWLLPLLLVVVPLGSALSLWMAAGRAQVRPRDAALALDDRHRTHDRISSAMEFASEDTPVAESRFAAAAIEDGVALVHRVDPHLGAAQPVAVRVPWRSIAASVLVALLPALLPLPAPGVGPGQQGRGDAARPGSAPSERETPASRPDPTRPGASAAAGEEPGAGRPAGEVGAQPAPAATKVAEAAPAGGAAAARSAAPTSPTEGGGARTPRKPGDAAPAVGAGAGGTGQSGAEANAGQEKKAETPPQAPGRKPAQTPVRDDKKPSESSGTPSGAARAGGRMAAVGNTREGQERTTEREPTGDTPDEPVDDDQDESEQRGGVMPMRRDRQNTVSRELSISGDGPPSDGRGGPTPPKKSRGTAALVLGITLPDQVRGQPNPGTAKTSLEQAPPAPEPGPRAGAEPANALRPPTYQSPGVRPDELQPALLRYHQAVRAPTRL
ncbi:MAG: hypothetical protein IT458_18190 [Planctomycetes bacterium]|nr:hypothetical protein [Planctomycetota bacterium]